MPLGRFTRLPIPGIAPISITALSLLLTIGCSVVPPTSRLLPRHSDVRTQIGPASEKAELEPEAQSPPMRPALDTLDEVSPLPPAFRRSPPAMSVSATPEPTPLLDAALRQAEALNESVIEEATKPETAPALRAEAVPEPSVQATPMPQPAEPMPEVKVASAPPTPPTPPKPEDLWRDGVQSLRAVARERIKESGKEAKSGSPNWAIRERLLGWLAEPDIDPDPRSSEDVAQGRAVLKGLAAILDPAASPTTRGPEIREAVTALESEAPLEVAELKVCRKVDGFGNIEPLEPSLRKAGQPIILYCEMNGLAYEPAGPAFRSRLAGKLELFPEASDASVWNKTLDTAEDTCRRRRRDYYVNYRLNLPETLAPGRYLLRLTQKDLVTDHEASRETVLTIVK